MLYDCNSPRERRSYASIGQLWFSPGSRRIPIDLAGLAMSGMFIVPRYAILRTGSPAEGRWRVIAANEIVTAIVMVPVVLIATLLLGGKVQRTAGDPEDGYATLPAALLWHFSGTGALAGRSE